MLRKRMISIILVLVLLLTVFSTFAFAGGGGCPTTADYYVTGTVNSDETFTIYKGDIPGLPSDYYIKSDEPYCETCGDADVKGDYPDRYIKFDPSEDTRCCGTAIFFFKVGIRGTDKTVKVTLDVVQSYDYEITDTINSGQIYKLYENDPRLPDGTNMKDKFYCSSGICGDLDYKGVEGPDYIQYVPYEENCSDCHWECDGCRCGCGGCEWVCEDCETRDCCGPNTFYFKIEVEEEYERCGWVCIDWGCGGCKDWDWRCWTDTRTVDKIVKATVTVNCEPPCETAPIANDDSYRINENSCANFNVLENDIDPEDLANPDLTIVDVTVPDHGTAVISGNNIYYCPQGNYCGEDTFYYQIETENGCAASNYAKVTVTILCKTPLSESLLYPNLGIERLNIPATGANIISDGQIISALEVVPGTQSLIVDVENRGMVTQADVKVTFEGLPEGVSFVLEPSTQKITAHNIGAFSLTLTASPDVPEGTYQVTIKAFSQRGSLDQKVITVVIT